MARWQGLILITMAVLVAISLARPMSQIKRKKRVAKADPQYFYNPQQYNYGYPQPPSQGAPAVQVVPSQESQGGYYYDPDPYPNGNPYEDKYALGGAYGGGQPYGEGQSYAPYGK